MLGGRHTETALGASFAAAGLRNKHTRASESRRPPRSMWRPKGTCWLSSARAARLLGDGEGETEVAPVACVRWHRGSLLPSVGAWKRPPHCSPASAAVGRPGIWPPLSALPGDSGLQNLQSSVGLINTAPRAPLPSAALSRIAVYVWGLEEFCFFLHVVASPER